MSCPTEARLRSQLTGERDQVGRLARQLSRLEPGSSRAKQRLGDVRAAKESSAEYERLLEEHRSECAECAGELVPR